MSSEKRGIKIPILFLNRNSMKRCHYLPIILQAPKQIVNKYL